MRKLLILLVCACATSQPAPEREKLEASAWESARAAHTIFAYRRFLKDFEDSRHSGEARQLVEGLRWAQAEKDGSEAALAAYVAEEPHGAHASDAWARLSSIRLARALSSGSAVSLRTWLAENPSGAGRDKAAAALDEADWREATQPAAWRKYVDDHPDGAHRKEAQARLEKAARDEAELLEDEAALRKLGDPAADRIAYERAAALLDIGRLAQLARRPGPFAADAKRDLRLLRRERRPVQAAANRLFLPRATLDDLPDDAAQRALRLREWAAALDGTRLHRILLELASPRARVALAALDSAEALLKGLPAAEVRIRAEREIAVLAPVALDAPQLTAIALLQLALGRTDDALATVRSTSSRCAPAVVLAARLETEKPMQQIAQQAVRDLARDLAARGEPCAAVRLDPTVRVEADCTEKPLDFAQERVEAARWLAAAATPLARPALARAAARDPDPAVRAAAAGAVALDLGR